MEKYRFKTKEELNCYGDLNGIEALKKDLEEGYKRTATMEFDYYFEPIPELPKIELKPQETKDYKIQFKYGQWRIIKFDYNGDIMIKLGQWNVVQSIKDFNKKCSNLFEFELIEPYNHEDRTSE